jgi:hypothetical protein
MKWFLFFKPEHNAQGRLFQDDQECGHGDRHPEKCVIVHISGAEGKAKGGTYGRHAVLPWKTPD